MKRTIREVKIGDVVKISSKKYQVWDVGINGFVIDKDTYWRFEEAINKGFTIKQPEQGIDIAGILIGNEGIDIVENRKYIIELQKAVNELKELKK